MARFLTVVLSQNPTSLPTLRLSMKRGFLKREKQNIVAPISNKDGDPKSTTDEAVIATPNLNINFSCFSRTYSRQPYIVEADHRLPSSVNFLFHPANSPSMVFIDSLENTLLFDKWITQLQVGGNLPAVEDSAFVIRDCGPKGLGVLARRAIGRGELIMLERPVYVSRPGVSLMADHQTAFYESTLAGLAPDAQASILSMRNARDEFGPILGRIHTNALAAKMPAPFDAKARYVALFRRICRLNHDCTPNTHYAFCSETFTGQLFAIRAIAPGEELTLGYIDLAAQKETRQLLLASKYRFDCMCNACELPEDQALVSDIRRQAIADYFARLAGGIRVPEGASLAEVKELIRYAENEGLVEAASILIVSALRLARKDKNRKEELKCVLDGVDYMRALEGNDALGFRTMASRLGLTTEQLAHVFDSGEPIDYARFQQILIQNATKE